MTDLSAQKRLAADVLDVGKDRVWFDPEAQSEIAEAITREDIRDLVDQGTIQQKGASNNSRGRARERADKQAYGHRTGAGSRRGTAGARENSKKNSGVDCASCATTARSTAPSTANCTTRQAVGSSRAWRDSKRTSRTTTTWR